MKPICSVVHCDRVSLTRGYCNAHYKRVRLGQSLDTPIVVQPYKGKNTYCTVEGCDGKARAMSYCGKHHGRYLQNGDPNTLRGPRDQHGSKNAQWRADGAGYAAAHLRIGIARGNPIGCVECGEDRLDKTYEWSLNRERAETMKVSRDGYDFSTQPDDYDRLCVPCHRRRDHAHKRSVRAK